MADQLIQRLGYLSDNDLSFQKELIQIFLAESEKNIRLLDQLADEGDILSAAKANHALKGSALNVGAVGISNTCETLELSLEQGVDHPALRQSLRQEFTRIRELLLAHIQSLG